MSTLALDLGNNVGFAYRREYVREYLHECSTFYGMLYSGCHRVRDRKQGPALGVSFLAFRRWLEDLTEETNPNRIVHEAIFIMPSFVATRLYFGMAAEVEAVCARRAIPPPVTVNSMRLKKWLCDYGHAKKSAVLAKVEERWKPGLGEGHVCVAKQCDHPTHDHADAIAILHYALEAMTV